MTFKDFDSQMARLRMAFGKTHLTSEHGEMIWKSSCDLTLEQFMRMTDFFISTLHKAPLPKDFEVQGTVERKEEFKKQNKAASELLDQPWPKGLAAWIEGNYPGCKNLNEVLNRQRAAK